MKARFSIMISESCRWIPHEIACPRPGVDLSDSNIHTILSLEDNSGLGGRAQQHSFGVNYSGILCDDLRNTDVQMRKRYHEP